MSKVKNILLVGVGGQGTILASKILTMGLIESGYDVKMSEVHGMSQRGGSVVTQVRYGSKVYSPLFGKGEADVIVSFEAMEGLRLVEYLKKNGKIVVNDYKLAPLPILIGDAEYSEDILDELKSKANTTIVEAVQIANELGNPKCMNLVLLGALVKALEIENINWNEIIKKSVKEKYVRQNITAFNLGYSV